jgi:predicted RNase H-like HicB family nuclease
MRCTVFLRQRPDGKYQAWVPLMPGITEVGDTRETTIQALAQAIHAALETTEYLTIELPDGLSPQPNPWLVTAGGFADDATLERLLQDMYTARGSDN